MSKRNWIIAVALGLILLLAIGIAGYQLGRGIGELRGEREARANDYAEHTGNHIQSACFGLDAIAQAECVERIVEASNENQRAEYDLIAQSEMSTWAFWMLWATLGMAAITAFGVYFVWRTLKATQEMAVETTRIGEAQVRAYITFDSVKAHVKVIDSSVEVTFIVKIRNSGQSPARRITTSAQMVQGTSDIFYFRDLASGENDEKKLMITHDYEAITFVGGSITDMICAVEISVFFFDVFSKKEKATEKSFFMGIIDILDGEKIAALQQVGELEFAQRGKQH